MRNPAQLYGCGIPHYTFIPSDLTMHLTTHYGVTYIIISRPLLSFKPFIVCMGKHYESVIGFYKVLI